MARRNSPFAELQYRVGATTAWMMAVLLGASILGAILGLWLQLFSLSALAAFTPGAVLRGQIWRLITYPWVTREPISLLFGLLAFSFLGPALEGVWGTRRFLTRSAILIVVPAALITLLAVPIHPLLETVEVGPWGLLIPFFVAFACELPEQPINFYFVLNLKGDVLLMVQGALLALFVLFSGSIAGHVLQIVSFLFALGWFRFGAVKGLRRSWLRFRKRQIEARMTKLRKRSNLRIVSSDDDDEPKRYLH